MYVQLNNIYFKLNWVNIRIEIQIWDICLVFIFESILKWYWIRFYLNPYVFPSPRISDREHWLSLHNNRSRDVVWFWLVETRTRKRLLSCRASWTTRSPLPRRHGRSGEWREEALPMRATGNGASKLSPSPTSPPARSLGRSPLRRLLWGHS